MKQLVLILGAGRSGTQFLSQILAHDPSFDRGREYRYVWNYKQADLRHDFRPASDATDSVANYIKEFFNDKSDNRQRFIVDKTPSNSFKIEFIRQIFPNSKVVHIIRDGRDNVLSRMQAWYAGAAERSGEASFSSSTLWATNRRDLISRAGRRTRNLIQLGRLPWDRWPIFVADNILPMVSHLTTGRPRRYGERIPGLASQLNCYGLMITCGIQWRECVMQALVTGRRLPGEDYIEIKYEDLIGDPETQWTRLANFFSISPDSTSLEFLMAARRTGSLERWREHLTQDQLVELEPHIRPTLEFLGYPWD